MFPIFRALGRCALVVMLGAMAQARADASGQAPSDTARPPSEDAGRPEVRLYLGMWTEHLKRPGVRFDGNWLVGLSVGPVFGGTFRNSFGHRAFAGGYQRRFVVRRDDPLTTSIGFRGGVVTGYDRRFMAIAGKTPVLPLVQVFGNVDLGRTGIEVSYTIVVISVTTSYRF